MPTSRPNNILLRITCSQEHQPDKKTGAALPQKALELQISNFGAMGKVVVDRRLDQFFGIFGWPLVQVDAQFERSFGEKSWAQLTMILRVVVDILFNERRKGPSN